MAEILLFGVVGDEADGLDAKTLVPQITRGTDPLDIRLNSPGGFVMEGLAIYNAVMRARAAGRQVNTHVDGLAASMASIIAMAGEQIVMADNSLLMVHLPWDVVIGNAPAIRAAADQLDLMRDQMVNVYAGVTGLSAADLIGMMVAETWMDASQALASGFITSISSPRKAVAMAKATGLGFRHLPDRLKENDPMTDTASAVATAITAERERSTKIRALCDKHGLGLALAEDMVSKGTPLAQASEVILDRLATRSDAMGMGHNRPGAGGHETLDNPGTYNIAVRDALTAKISGKAATGPAAEFQHMSVAGIARDMMTRNGDRNVHRLTDDRVIAAAWAAGNPQAITGRDWSLGRGDIGGMVTTSDLPDLIGGAAEKFLIERYKLQQSPLKQLGRQRSVSNFLTHYGVQVSNFGTLDGVNEAGEFKNKAVTTRKEGYAIQPWGDIFSVSRQMLVNDALGALSDIINNMAGAAARTEAMILASLFNNNIVMGDGHPWFDSAHNNYVATGSGAVPSVAAYTAGWQAMRSQLDPNGVDLIDVTPKYILTPLPLEIGARIVNSSINPTNTSEVNPFAGLFTIISEPRLADQHAWYMIGDPDFSPAIQFSYLDGQDAPFTDSKEGWRVDGTEYKVRHDFGAGVLDARMAWKNAGN